MPHDDPSGRHGEPLGVLRAQIMRVRIVSWSEGTERSHLIAVVEGERRHRLARARHLGAQALLEALSIVEAESFIHQLQRRAVPSCSLGAARST